MLREAGKNGSFKFSLDQDSVANKKALLGKVIVNCVEKKFVDSSHERHTENPTSTLIEGVAGTAKYSSERYLSVCFQPSQTLFDAGFVHVFKKFLPTNSLFVSC